MNFTEWNKNVNKLALNNNLKNNIVTFFKEFRHESSLSFIPIQNTTLISAFNNINNYKPITLCLDIEFQSAIVQNTKYIYTENIKKDKTAKFIREIGILLFVTDQNENIYYIGHLFLNFASLVSFGFDLKNIKLIGVKYATVSDDTYIKMNQLESTFHLESIIDPLFDKYTNATIKDIILKLNKNYLFLSSLPKNKQTNIINILNKLKNIDNRDIINKELRYIKRQLGQIQYEIYAKYLKSDDLTIFNKLDKLYWQDELVQSRMALIKNKYDVFMSLFESITQESVLVIKGRMDIVALKNVSMLILNKDLNLDHTYDIETFNGFSRTQYNSSQLENTYKGLIETNIYKTIGKSLFDEIIKNIGNKAHNPVVDSLFTIIVAIVMNLGINYYFEKVDSKKGGYYEDYMKYKYRYLKLKH